MFIFEFLEVDIPLDRDFPCACFTFIRWDFNKIADKLDVQFSDDIGIEHECTFQ